MAASGLVSDHLVDALGRHDAVRRGADQLTRVPACLAVRVDEHSHELKLRVPFETPDYLGADATRVELR